MRVVITGGAGFIGSNLTSYFLEHGNEVVVFDNLSRPGTAINANWLNSLHGKLRIVTADVHDYDALRSVVRGADAIYHLAAQVAVTASVADPRLDFEVNAQGTFNVLEAIRSECPSAFLAYSSTNKVYGAMEDWEVLKDRRRYIYAAHPEGVPEDRPLDFHSPYGCSKGTGDQYVRDYARIYGLNSVVFRQACIYGPHQFGNEDQGWVAHLVVQAAKGRPITIYGDGFQVRDVLHVDDLVLCYARAIERSSAIRGQVFNVGGGPGSTLSLNELVAYLESKFERHLQYQFADWRPGDQRVYISNIRKAAEILDWEPSIGVERGLDQLISWVAENLYQIQ